MNSRLGRISWVALLLATSSVAEELRILDGGMVRSFERVVETTARGTEKIVLYETGRPRTAATRRVVTRDLCVRLQPGAAPEAAVRASGGTVKTRPTYAPDYWVVSAADANACLNLAQTLKQSPGILDAQPLLARQQQKKLVPNDPLFGNQWHLRNTGQGGATPGIDANLEAVWDTYTGSGITIGIVDDGMQFTHPDLSPNANTAIDIDINDDDNDPTPFESNEDWHGTAVAGVAGAKGNNSRGVCGAAFDATLVGIRLIAASTTDAEEASAASHRNDLIDIQNNSWGPYDDGYTLEGAGPLLTAAFHNAVATGRGGLGTVFTWAGGNGLDSDDQANKDGYANLCETISVAAVDDDGNQAEYSEPGSCHVVAAPSDGGSANLAITTTDLLNDDGYNGSWAGSDDLSDRDYTETFGGTSSATPLVSGVVALILDANPTLGWRDVQAILVESATTIDAGDAGWHTNGAGLDFNNKYGAGLINAQAAVALATNGWTHLGTRMSSAASESSLSLSIPDNNSTGVSRTFNFNAVGIRVEHVTLSANITHPYRGDVVIDVTSPAGTVSRLMAAHGDNGANYSDWTFMSTHFWGELAPGTWTVNVSDGASGGVGTLNDLTLTVYGETASVSNLPPQVVNPGPQSVLATNALAFDVTATELDGDTITLSALNLPAGASFAPAVGTSPLTQSFAWTPGTNQIGSHLVTFRAEDIHGTHEVDVTITVGDPTASPPLDIGGYTLHQYDSTQTYTVPAGTFISAGGYVVVGRNSTQSAFESVWGVNLGADVLYLDAGDSGIAINGGETFELRDAGGSTIDGPSALALAGGGAVQRNSAAADADLASSWTAVPEASATPGSGGSGNQTAGVVINEYSDRSGSGNYIYEFVELYFDAPSGGTPSTQPPTISGASDATVVVSNTLQFTVTATEPDSDPVTLSATNLPSNASFPIAMGTGSASGPFTFTPDDTQTGQVYNVSFIAIDPDGAVTQSVAITVTPDTPPPSGGAVLTYDFQDGTDAFEQTPDTVATHLTGSIFTSSGGSPTDFSGVTGRAIADTGWDVSDLSAYFEFAVTIDAAFTLDVNELTFWDRASGTGAQAWELRASADGFTSTLGSGPTHTSFTSNAVPMSLTGLTGTVTFRIYGENASAAGGTWRLDDVTLTGAVQPLAGNGDIDNDLIPDDWETLYSGTTTGVNAAIDADLDGFTGWQEYLADTNPGDSNDFLSVDGIQATPPITVEFDASTGRVYRLQTRTNLTSGADWMDVAGPRQATNSTMHLSDTNALQPRMFYRLDAELP